MEFLTENYAEIARIVLEILAVIGVTKWGLANKRALDLVTQAIERITSLREDDEAKNKVAVDEYNLSPAAREALYSAIARAESTVLGGTDKPLRPIWQEVLMTVISLIPSVLRVFVKPVITIVIGSALLAGTLTGLSSCVTTVGMDGTRTTRIDEQAIAVLTPLVLEALDRVEMYEARRAEAEARKDKEEVEKYETLLSYWERILASRENALKKVGGEVPNDKDA